MRYKCVVCVPGLRFAPSGLRWWLGGLSLMATNPLLKGLPPMHPGEMLREDVLPSLGKSKTYVAKPARNFASDLVRQPQRKAADHAGDGPALRQAARQRAGPLDRFAARLQSSRRRKAIREGACEDSHDHG